MQLIIIGSKKSADSLVGLYPMDGIDRIEWSKNKEGRVPFGNLVRFSKLGCRYSRRHRLVLHLSDFVLR